MHNISATLPESKPALQNDATNDMSLEDMLRGTGMFSDENTLTDLAHCLVPLLEALGWNGEMRNICEAIPYLEDEIFSITSFRNTLAHLHYSSRKIRIKLGLIDPSLMPCLFIPNAGGALVLLRKEDDEIIAYDGKLRKEVRLPANCTELGMAYFFRAIEKQENNIPQYAGLWFWELCRRFHTIGWHIMLLSTIISVLVLASPIFIMIIYDKVIGSGSTATLAYLAFGLAVAVITEAVFRSLRTQCLAFIGARLDYVISSAVFERLLFLAPTFTERSSVSSQISRLKDFETIREFFTSPMALIYVELPFTAMILGAIAWIAGPLAAIALVMMMIFGVFILFMRPHIRKHIKDASHYGSAKQRFVYESVSKMRDIRLAGINKCWTKRYRDLSGKATLANFKSAFNTSIVETMAYVLMIASGVATMAVGVTQVLAGSLSVGALVATMILVWRVLSPLQVICSTWNRLEQMYGGLQQVHRLMKITPERETHIMPTPIRSIQGHVEFSRVSLRYQSDADPVLVGASFTIRSGEVVAITGNHGSGKSTILKLLMGLYKPQAGSIRIDDIDIRQLDPIELRYALAYVPQKPELFHGTILKNLRMAKPTATEEMIEKALEHAGILEDIRALPDGINSFVGDAHSEHLPHSLVQGITLARAYVKDAPILMFDDVHYISADHDSQHFCEFLDTRRGHKTTIFITNQPEYLALADSIIMLEAGQITASGATNDILPQINTNQVRAA